jgi:hypothetical protein
MVEMLIVMSREPSVAEIARVTAYAEQMDCQANITRNEHQTIIGVTGSRSCGAVALNAIRAAQQSFGGCPSLRDRTFLAWRRALWWRCLNRGIVGREA